MLSASATRRNRTSRRSRDTVRKRGVADADRGRLEALLETCSATDRRLLALLLVDHLTPIEAAEALGLPVRQLTRAYQRLFSTLRRAVRSGAASGSAAHTALPQTARVRKAS